MAIVSRVDGGGFADWRSRIDWTLLVSLCSLAAVLGLYYRPLAPALHHGVMPAAGALQPGSAVPQPPAPAEANAGMQPHVADAQQQVQQLRPSQPSQALASSPTDKSSPSSSDSSTVPSDGANSSGQCGNGPGPWQEPRPQLSAAEHPFPASLGAYIAMPCAQIACRRDLIECPSSDKTCCTHWLCGILEFLSWFFTTRGLKWQIAYGTMLGAFRNGTILPWDHDGDMMVDTELYNLIQSADNSTLRQEAWRYGMLLRPNEGPYVMGKACYHPGHPDLQSDEGDEPPAPGPVKPFIDLFEARRVEGGNGEQNLYQAWLDEGTPAPIEKLTFSKLYCMNGLNLIGPDDADDHLTAYYKDWRTPRKEAI